MQYPIRNMMTVCCLAMALLLAPLVVHAHAMQTETQPADGETLETAPEQVAVQFDAPMRLTRLMIKDEGGEGVPLRDSLNREVAKRHEVAPRNSLPPGRYTVSWRGMAEDGHVMSGKFHFTVH